MSSASEVGTAEITAGPSRRRSAFLTTESQLLGASWARDWCKTMKTEGRRVEGGWPGTMPEARARALGHLDRELLGRGMTVLSPPELQKAAAATYERAKQEWLRAAREVESNRPARSERKHA